MKALKDRTFAVVITGIALGLLIVSQARSFQNVQGLATRDSRANIFRELKILKTTNVNLQNEISDLEEQLAKASDQQQSLGLIEEQIQKNRMIAGYVDITGPGVEVVLNQEVPVIWMTDMVNELWAAGAQAVSVNDIRLTESTIGFDILPNKQISLNGVILTAPYHIQAIGESKTLLESLKQPQGIIQRFQEALPKSGIDAAIKEKIVMQKVL